MRRRLLLALLVLSFGVSACSDEPEAARDESGAVESEGAVGALDVEVGDCVVAPSEAATAGSEGVESLTAVPCSESHDGEVYSTFDLPDGEFPGEAAVSTAGEQRCSDDFATYVGLPFADSALDVSTLYPSEQTWAQGDREYVCIAVDPAGGLTESVKGAAR